MSRHSEKSKMKEFLVFCGAVILALASCSKNGVDGAKVARAKADLEDMKSQFLGTRAIKGSPLDPWGREYFYKRAGYVGGDNLIYSLGQNGKDEGGEGDDIKVSWQQTR